MVNTDAEYILVLGDRSYGVPFDLMGYEVQYCMTPEEIPTDKQITEAELVLFTGGSDVSPALYGEENSILLRA